MLQAIHGDPLLRVSSDMPEDVRILHDALETLREYDHRPIYTSSHPLRLYLGNNGTALRFLQVHLQVCYPGEPIMLEGDPRLMERDGKPTSQTTSARILHGIDVLVTPDEGPYITMTRKVMEMYKGTQDNVQRIIEADWSAAAFWYEYVATHGGELLLEGLTEDSLQGDRIVADIYAEHFGVETTFTPQGAFLHHTSHITHHTSVSLDFTDFPDLYPAVALTCEKLGIELNATGTERLRYKESDRLEAVRLHEVRNDHRIAMALMCADYPVSINEQTCIAKSYPEFAEQYARKLDETRRSTDGQPTVKDKVTIPSVQHITPIRGVNDDNLGKKHALSKLIHTATAEYVWLHDDDVVWPLVCQPGGRSVSEAVCQCNGLSGEDGLVILPLKMESLNEHPSLLEKLQIAEYAAIQELTMRTAKKGRAVMCSGANLIVRRKTWLECEPDLHPEIPSGDDMFLLEAAKRRGYKIGVIDEPDYTAIVRPQTSWRAFFRQRMRWAGKAPHYTDSDIRRCGALVVVANLLQILCPLIILIKFPIEYSLICQRQIREHASKILNLKSQISNILTILLLELFYPFYIFIAFLGGLVRRTSW